MLRVWNSFRSFIFLSVIDPLIFSGLVSAPTSRIDEMFEDFGIVSELELVHEK